MLPPTGAAAGAGAGKTKTLTTKIAYLIEEQDVDPENILAITFTNKAANEMKQRIEGLVGGQATNDMWIGTFHSICVRILRRYIDRIGYESSFIIFDTSDQKTLVKQCLRELNIDDKLFTDRSVLSEISNAKNEMLIPEQYLARANGEYRKEKIAQVYSLYQQRLKENNAVDFDDIINLTIKILMENPDVLAYYSEKFKYVLVDEFQDCDELQIEFLKLINEGNELFAVGDEDQCIYSFRGSKPQYMVEFNNTFKEGKKFLYVSTDEVYGSLEDGDTYFYETTPFDPHSPYSASKASGDMLTKAYWNTYKFPINITSCSNNYGPYQFPEKLIPLIINNALQGKKLPVYGDGKNVRDWLYVDDHAKAIDMVQEQGVLGERYNVGGHNEKTNLEIVKIICKELGKPESLITYVADRKGHDMRYAIDPTKIQSELGWLPETMFKDGIKKTIQWYLDNREWWETIISGEYQNYYDKMYKNR